MHDKQRRGRVTLLQLIHHRHHPLFLHVIDIAVYSHKGKFRGGPYLLYTALAAYMSQIRDQKRFTILEVAADRQEPLANDASVHHAPIPYPR